VPDIRGKEPKEAKKILEQAGLRLGEQREACADLGDNRSEQAEIRRGRIACQSAEPGTAVALQTVIDYVLVSEKGADRND
jgi:beta-lactam-binding protein with PASTA domain